MFGRVRICVGKVLHRGAEKDVCISLDDLFRHQYVLGATGTGKSTLINHEVLQALRDRGCTSRERAFTLDAILEIAQMEASSYPAINKALKHYGISGTKQRLALVLASLRRRGLIGEVIVSGGNEHIKKYYVVGEHHETPSSIR